MELQYVGLTGEFTNISVSRAKEKGLGDDVARFKTAVVLSNRSYTKKYQCGRGQPATPVGFCAFPTVDAPRLNFTYSSN